MTSPEEEVVVPPEIEAAILAFEGLAAIDEREVGQAIGTVRAAMEDKAVAQSLGTWSEVLAFALTPNQGRSSPWGTYFGPTGSMKMDDGTTQVFPDITGTPPKVIGHWTGRARSIRHPVLRARYADLSWDLSNAIAATKPDHKMALAAIDAYLESASKAYRDGAHQRFSAANRALDLSITLKDAERVARAREALLALHREAMEPTGGLWWIAVDRLLEDQSVGLSGAERDQLVADLETIVVRHSNVKDSAVFDPHATESAANRLIKQYAKRRMGEDIKRLHIVIAKTFEHFASLGNAMLASSVLQTAANAYRKAGLTEESQRVRVEMEAKILASHSEMTHMVYETEISNEDMEEFLKEIVVPDIAQTFANIARWFLQRPSQLEASIATQKEQSPLSAMIGQTLVADNFVSATIGSVDDDPFGRLVRQASMEMSLSDIWLVTALDRAIAVHELTPGHFAGWTARSKLFNDLTLLLEGVGAWQDGDDIKAIHVLVPQIELALRSIVSTLGQPVTKPHRKILGVSVAIGMGDILYEEKVRAAIGPEITLHLLAIYADPRGFNLRNELAHGLLKAEEVHRGLVARVIHTLLVLGVWELLSAALRAESDNPVAPKEKNL